jgi:hypothetical protein
LNAQAGPSPADHAFVVLAYGDSPFLEGCLASLRDQTRPGPILVATSTPSPFIEAAARRAAAPLLVNPRREGIGADWNFALEAGASRLVTLAHQDDVYRPQFAERTLAALAACPGAGLAFTGYDEIDDEGRPVSSRISRVKHLLEAATLGEARCVGPARLRAFLSLGNPLPCSSVTFDRHRLGEFRFSTGLQSNLDWEAWLRLAQSGVGFARARGRLVGRRHNPLTATSRLIREGVRQREDLAMFRRLWPPLVAETIAFLYRAGY